jgi:predicted protein tyrosine phosphatase
MDEIASGLFVGTSADAGDQSQLAEHDITTVVSLTHSEPDGGFPASLTVHRRPMMDGPQNDHETFTTAVRDVLSEREVDERVLVHCSAGASRSPAVVATALALSTELTLEGAFQRLAERRSAVDPHEALIRQASRVTDCGKAAVMNDFDSSDR